MPRFTTSRVEGQRGSYSSPPLLVVYYFCLLALVGVSTVTSTILVIWDRQIRFGGKVPRFLFAIMWVAEKIGCGAAGKRRYHQENFEIARAAKASAEDAEEPCNDIPTSPMAEGSMGPRGPMADGPMASCDKELRRICHIVTKIDHDLDKFAKTRTAAHPSYTLVRFIEQALFYFYIGLLFTLVFMFFYNDWY